LKSYNVSVDTADIAVDVNVSFVFWVSGAPKKWVKFMGSNCQLLALIDYSFGSRASTWRIGNAEISRL